MSREEAIKYLNEFIIFKKILNITEEEAVECFELAVEALQEQPSDDCISREAALNIIKHICFSEEYAQFRADYGSNGQRDTVITYIKALPSVTPQQKKRTETHECDCISRQAVLELLHKRFADGFDSDKCWNSTVVLYAINEAPPVTPQPKTEGARGDIPLQQSVPEMPQPKTEQESFEDCIRKSVIVHPKKGHWIGDKGATVYVNSEGNLADFIACKCSECGEWLTGSDVYVCGGRFCPSCGIKMEEKK